MSASSSLSVELWQTVLRYSIGIADFLDADAFEGMLTQQLITDKTFSNNDEKEYWRTEKTRMRLRLVSHSWNWYLRQFEHRFVRMLDIRHKTIDISALKRAIRVSFSRHSCECSEYCIAPWPGGKFESFCWQTIEEAETLDMQIADMMDEGFRVGELIPHLPKLDKVTTFIGPSCTYSGYFSQVLNRLPNLRHFYGKGYWGIREHGPIKSISSSNLVTLSFHNRVEGGYHEVSWNLPSLRYLRFKDDSDEPLSDFVSKSLLPLLGAVGFPLRSLYLYHRIGEYELPREVWDLCPRLTSLRTGMSLTASPPFFHPIRKLVVVHEIQLHDFKPPPEWPNLRHVLVDQWILERENHGLEGRPDVIVEYGDAISVNRVERENLRL